MDLLRFPAAKVHHGQDCEADSKGNLPPNTRIVIPVRASPDKEEECRQKHKSARQPPPFVRHVGLSVFRPGECSTLRPEPLLKSLHREAGLATRPYVSARAAVIPFRSAGRADPTNGVRVPRKKVATVQVGRRLAELVATLPGIRAAIPDTCCGTDPSWRRGSGRGLPGEGWSGSS